MTTRVTNLIKTVLPALVIAVVVLLVSQQPQGREQEATVSSAAVLPALTLQPQQQVTQSFLATGRPIAGLVLFSPLSKLSGQVIEVTIYDEDNTVLARSYPDRSEFRHDSLAIWLKFGPPLATEAKQKLRLVISNSGTRDLPLIFNNENSYANGQLLRDGLGNDSDDVSFSLVHPTKTTPATNKGMLAGAVVLLGSVLIAQLSRFRWTVAVILLLMTLPAAVAGFWFSSDLWGMSDWDFYQSMHQGFKQTVLTYNSFPLWNPYNYGGIAGLGDPEFAGLSFTFLPQLILDVPTGFKAALLISIVISGLGMLTLSKRLGLSTQGALLTAIAYPVSATVLLKFVEGHIQHLATAWIPWVLVSWLAAYQYNQRPRSVRNLLHNKWALLTGLFLALMFYQGGIYMLFYLVPALLVFIVIAKRFRAALATTLSVGLWAAGFSALKLLPVLWWIKEFPDDFYHVSQFTLPYLTDIFLRRHLHGATIIPNQGGGWHEYGAYLGAAVLGLALIGASQVRRRRIVRVLLIGTALSLLTASAGPLLEPLFDVLTWLPRSNISRLALFSVITIVLLAGFGLDTLHRHSSVQGKYLVPALVGLVAIDIMSLAYPMSEQAFVVPPLKPAVTPATDPISHTGEAYTIRLNGSDEDRSYAAALANYGTLSYRPPLAPPLSVVTANKDASYLTTSHPAATATVQSWTPNKIKLTVTSPDQTTVTLNGNYSVGWHVNGSPASNHSGLVGTTVPGGTHQLIFSYQPRGLRLGLPISAATILLAGFVTWPRVKRKKE